MRFLVDECCPRQLVEALRASGHDVRYAVDSHPRADDGVLSGVALREHRNVVTADYDFGERVIRFGERLPGVVLLAPSTEPMSVRIERISRAIGHLASALTDHLTIVDDERVRRRSLR